jgi:hypothetical protein
MIAQLSGFPDDVLAFGYSGHITKADYDVVLLPAVRAALARSKGIRIYCENSTDFSGFEPGAVWEDLKIGLGHLTRWDRVAVVTDVHWLEHTTRFISFLVPGQIKTFPASHAAEARAWVAAA